VSAKRGWVLFGAKPAQSEAPARAAPERRPHEQGRSGRRKRSRLEVEGTFLELERRQEEGGLSTGVTWFHDQCAATLLQTLRCSAATDHILEVASGALYATQSFRQGPPRALRRLGNHLQRTGTVFTRFLPLNCMRENSASHNFCCCFVKVSSIP